MKEGPGRANKLNPFLNLIFYILINLEVKITDTLYCFLFTLLNNFKIIFKY